MTQRVPATSAAAARGPDRAGSRPKRTAPAGRTAPPGSGRRRQVMVARGRISSYRSERARHRATRRDPVESISAEIASLAAAHGAGRPGSAAGLPALPQQRAAAPGPAPGRARPGGGRAGHAGVRAPGRRPDRRRPDRPAPGEPIGERMVVTGRITDGAGRPVRRPAGRGLAGQRGRAVRAQPRPAPGPAGPQLHRHRALPHRRRRLVPVRHDQAGAVPVAQPPQRLAAGAHPLLPVRHGTSPSGW